MGLLAQSLGETPEPDKPGRSGTELMAARIGNVFGMGNEEDYRYGRELVTEGRAGLAAGVRLAVRGAGTNDELLSMVTANRSQREIREAEDDYRAYGDDEGLQEAIYEDVSGDLALEMELSLEGEPENDKDRLKLAAMRHRQETVTGTGWLARRTMQDTWQKEEAGRRRSELGATILQTALEEAKRTNDTAAIARLSAISPDAVFDERGNMSDDALGLAFGEDGNLRGDAARIAFASATTRLNSAADSYRAEIDRQEGIMTSLITGAAIAISLLLLVVPGVNLVAAGILTALIAGTATMAVKAGMRGGRYGWEEAAVDAGMMAVEAVTAGAGGAMAGSLGKAGMAGRLFKMGATMEKALGKIGAVIAREAIVGAVSHSAQTAMQDETWSKGLEHGLASVAGGALKGATISAVTARNLERRAGQARFGARQR